ncbi:hypothetical protein [Shewanella sp. GutDb-MelDb]|uniref:hypothetical protein n=1 Tax=Shewanella sp. GutDb-MelDb TaxID=2058316 RepID=UPI000C7A95EB|nr:hypothetical protein [Shewanella sp. GutDb-MelDb]PKG57260.1 hypothetical protein CXF82_10565 [Shewanella sp. GutDb-MelDb]
MKYLKIIIMTFFFVLPAHSSETKEYLNKLDVQYKALLNILNEDEREFWKSKYFDITIKATKIHDDYEGSVAYFKGKGEYEKYADSLLFSNVKEAKHSRLSNTTKVVEELGKLVFERHYQENLQTLLSANKYIDSHS